MSYCRSNKEFDISMNNKNITVVLDKDGYVISHKYQVFFTDEYNNNYLIGFFNDLKDAEPEVNEFLETYEFDEDSREQFEAIVPKFGDNECLGHLEVYPSTFSMCFDRVIDTTCGCVQVRGFVFN